MTIVGLHVGSPEEKTNKYYSEYPDLKKENLTKLICILNWLSEMETSGMTLAKHRVRVEENHPVLKDEHLETYEKTLAYSGLKLHQEISFRNVKIY